MATLFLMNIPHDCSDADLQGWIEASGIAVKNVRMIRDLVAGVSPSFAYVDIDLNGPVTDAVQTLNGRKIRERTITVSESRRNATAA